MEAFTFYTEGSNAYHPQCSAISQTSFRNLEATEYNPSKANYYEDTQEGSSKAALIAAFICLIVFLCLPLLSCVLCCITHYWSANANFISIIKSGRKWWQRLFSFLFIFGILAMTTIITAMSIWGIVKVESDARNVVPDTFDFMEQTLETLQNIRNNLTTAASNGYEIVDALSTALTEFQQDQQTQAALSSANIAVDELLRELGDNIKKANDTLDTVQTEVNDNLDEIVDGLDNAVGYRDESEGINKGGRIVLICAFALFIFFAVGSSLISLYGVSPRCIMVWVMFMWLMLFMAFACVYLLQFGKDVSKDTCLFIDTYAVHELRNEVDRDEIRIEELLWYYFREPGTGDKSLEDLEKLWSFPLTSVAEFLQFSQDDVFYQNGGLRVPYSLAQQPTQQALLRVLPRIPQAQRDVQYVQDLIQGETLQTIHADLKTLICCTEYDAVKDIWTAWVVSSSFGLFLTILMTLQGLLSIRFSEKPNLGAIPLASPPAPNPMKQSAYMGPPVEEQHRYPFDVPVNTQRIQRQSNDVYYPEIQMPPAKF